jgi:hypothetical protein
MLKRLLRWQQKICHAKFCARSSATCRRPTVCSARWCRGTLTAPSEAARKRPSLWTVTTRHDYHYQENLIVYWKKIFLAQCFTYFSFSTHKHSEWSRLHTTETLTFQTTWRDSNPGLRLPEAMSSALRCKGNPSFLYSVFAWPIYTWVFIKMLNHVNYVLQIFRGKRLEKGLKKAWKKAWKIDKKCKLYRGGYAKFSSAQYIKTGDPLYCF